jgi:hypothetical protein
MEMSDKHGARMADELSKDTRAGHEEFRDQRPDDARIDVVQTQDGVLDDHEAAARSEIARFLEPSAFPARSGQLIETARQRFAGEEVINLLETLPDDTYDNVQDVWIALGGEVESRRA